MVDVSKKTKIVLRKLGILGERQDIFKTWVYINQ